MSCCTYSRLHLLSGWNLSVQKCNVYSEDKTQKTNFHSFKICGPKGLRTKGQNYLTSTWPLNAVLVTCFIYYIYFFELLKRKETKQTNNQKRIHNNGLLVCIRTLFNHMLDVGSKRSGWLVLMRMT